MKQSDDTLNLWSMAISTPYGVEIECQPDFESVRQKLYRARAEVKDPDLDRLALCQSPFDPGRAWIVRKDPANETP